MKRPPWWVFLLGLVVLGILMYVLFGSSGKNDAFQPQEEFRLTPWISLHIAGIDMSINKAVLYLFLAAGLTCFAMVYIARRMQERPNKVQTLVELAFDLTRNNITRGNLTDPTLAAKWFAFIATLFFFIWFSNMLGYLPLPTNTNEKINIFGAHIPALAIYAATANISIPLVLTLVVWFSYNIEGIRAHGFIGYLKSFVPGGITGGAAIPLFVIEVISHFVRIISLSVRLFANILAGHLLILFMAGGLVVLLGIPALGVGTLVLAIPFFLFEVALVATLQAFIFATLTSIYIGGATAEGH
ncbi:MAG: F-type H+-transporting ATPase subunit a [Thermoleophilaceae bacterium]|nr:F-type H+-transporting ATPase subunit a [Thermoleophilaceae bacterium]